MHSTVVGAVIKKLKAHFARHGSPCQLVSDNARQFVAAEFRNSQGPGTPSTHQHRPTLVRLMVTHQSAPSNKAPLLDFFTEFLSPSLVVFSHSLPLISQGFMEYN